jgi:hypothetical protein
VTLAAFVALTGKMDEAKAALAEARDHGQMDDGAHAQSSRGVQRTSQGGAAGTTENRKLAAILRACGKMDEAKTELAEARRLNPASHHLRTPACCNTWAERPSCPCGR